MMSSSQTLRPPVPLSELIDPLTSFIAFPYLSGGAARAELAHPPVIAKSARRIDADGEPA